MRRREEPAAAVIPHWLLSPEGCFLVDTAAVVRWCARNDWRKLDVLAEAGRRHRAHHGITSARAAQYGPLTQGGD